jgi:hypothetical protein
MTAHQGGSGSQEADTSKHGINSFALVVPFTHSELSELGRPSCIVACGACRRIAHPPRSLNMAESIQIPAEWLREAGVQNFTPTGLSYRCTAHVLLALGKSNPCCALSHLTIMALRTTEWSAF